MSDCQRCERLEAALQGADELVEELLGYACQSWDWKYGDDWREEQAKLRAALAKDAAPAKSPSCAGCGRVRPLKYSHGTCSPLCFVAALAGTNEGKAK